MTVTSAGIHHVTSIASSPKRNVGFYVGEIGLRLVKRTVNFDDPGTYHLYFGDRVGSPGSAMTFFPWPDIRPGRHGIGQAEEVGYAVPRESIGWWVERLTSRGVPFEGPAQRFDETVLSIRDPDGHFVEIVGTDRVATAEGHPMGDIPADHTPRGFSGVTLWLEDAGPTADVLRTVFGFSEVGEENGRRRFAGTAEGIGRHVDLRAVGGYPRGALGAGIVHHVAFRAATDADQHAMADAVRAMGLDITPQIDRQYFRSMYFREPGGVLFEIASDDPGFTLDESVESLGETLKLPPQYEPHRDRIEQVLPPLD